MHLTNKVCPHFSPVGCWMCNGLICTAHRGLNRRRSRVRRTEPNRRAVKGDLEKRCLLEKFLHKTGTDLNLEVSVNSDKAELKTSSKVFNYFCIQT